MAPDTALDLIFIGQSEGTLVLKGIKNDKNKTNIKSNPPRNIKTAKGLKNKGARALIL